MGKQIRKQKKSSIIAGGFFRFALYLCVIVGVIYIGKSAYDLVMKFLIRKRWITRKTEEMLRLL